MNGDQNLLFGMLALQMDFISRDSLIAGLNAWVIDKQKPLGEILRGQGMEPEHHDLIDRLVEAHLKAHQGDVYKSLAAVPASSRLKEQLRSLRFLRDNGDKDLEAGLVSLGAAAREGADLATTAEPPGAGLMRYQILRPHAKGGLGEVFVALDEELNRKVDLKTLATAAMGLAEVSMRRGRRERREEK
jgi:hypothetical protein